MQRFLLLIFATFAFLSASATAAGAAAAMWRVNQKSGDVRVIRNRLQPAAARVDAALSPGDVVMTGATGRATLTRGGDYIVLAPSSRLLLPANAQQSGWTSLIQDRHHAVQGAQNGQAAFSGRYADAGGGGEGDNLHRDR